MPRTTRTEPAKLPVARRGQDPATVNLWGDAEVSLPALRVFMEAGDDMAKLLKGYRPAQGHASTSAGTLHMGAVAAALSHWDSIRKAVTDNVPGMDAQSVARALARVGRVLRPVRWPFPLSSLHAREGWFKS